MDFASFLNHLVGNTVTKIYYVDFNQTPDEDIYLPWVYFLVFEDVKAFLMVEGEDGANHIKLSLHELVSLPEKLEEYDLRNEPFLWHPYETTEQNPIHKLIGERISRIEYAVDKPFFRIVGNKMLGQTDAFVAVRFCCSSFPVTMFESGIGLLATTETAVVPYFPETYNWHFV